VSVLVTKRREAPGIDSLSTLLEVGANFDDLSNVDVGGKFEGTDLNLDKVLEVSVSKTLNLLGPGSREHEGLTVGTDLFENLLDLRFETHIEHAIGFVHDEVGDTTKVGLAGFEHVDQTTGGSDNDFGTSLEITNLSSFRYSSVNAGVADSRRRSKLGALFLNLNCEFTSGSEDENDGTVAGRKERLSVDVNHGGESERDGLSGTGGRDGDEVTSRESHGPSLTLNRRRSGETSTFDLGHDVGREVHLVEVGDRLGDVVSEDLDLLLATVFGDFTFGSSSDSLVLLVEVLLELDERSGIPVLSTKRSSEVAHWEVVESRVNDGIYHETRK